jgi:uncharacterized repeat protein (TIGR03803 family)
MALALPAQTTPVAPPTAIFTTLLSFDKTDGNSPSAGLVQATDGNLYGTTVNGGANGPYYGTAFKITPSGTLTTVYSFCSQINHGNCTDGQNPRAGLVQGTDGSFYGTTNRGGAHNNKCLSRFRGCGTVFKITRSGTLIKLHSFDQTDGNNPVAGLVQGTDGSFYATTTVAGPPAWARSSESSQMAR